MSPAKNMFLSGRRFIPRLLVGFLILLAFALGFIMRGGNQTPVGDDGHDHSTVEDVETTWTCSMHPQIKLPKAGQCPICFMDLIPLETGADEDLGPRTLVLSESAAALSDIQTAIVEKRSVNTEIDLIGQVNYDETLFRTISAWVPGRIDTLFVDFTGTTVTKGQPLVSLYSPELYAAQAELLNAVKADRELSNSKNDLMRETSKATVTSARERLKLWGLAQTQIDRIVANEKAQDHINITSPVSGIVVHKDAMEGMYVKTGTRIYSVADLSRVWVTLNAYETDLVWLKNGQTVNFTVVALPGSKFAGKIIFIDPVLNNKTRTVQVRIDADNQDGLLKPGMFVNAVAQAEFGRADSQESLPLVIPATAPLITGKRAVVYVRLPDTEKPTFEGREIILGPRVGDFYVVESGLSAGEYVVTKGNFKLDSALQILAKPSMMSPDGGAPVPGHNHGDSATDNFDTQHELPNTEARQTFTDVDKNFKIQLGSVLQAYLLIQAAMADDDDATASTAAKQLNTSLEDVNMSLLSGDAHLAWMSDLDLLQKSFAPLAAASDLETRRKALFPATEALWPTLQRYGYTAEDPVRLFHCQMANDYEGANWIQMPITTANPYFGSTMLRCGSQTDSLTTLAAGEGW